MLFVFRPRQWQRQPVYHIHDVGEKHKKYTQIHLYLRQSTANKPLFSFSKCANTCVVYSYTLKMYVVDVTYNAQQEK